MILRQCEETRSVACLLRLIEDELAEIVRPTDPSENSYYGMMQYHLGWVDESFLPLRVDVGKRLRPLLCLLCCEAAGGDPHQALPAAAALELIHNFSLVHDDIQDRSRVRRGRRAVWDVWGTSHGINVGDGLFVLAGVSLHRLADRGVPAARILSAIQALDRACLALCEGQFLDMSFEDRQQVSLTEYAMMIRHKTAALLAAAAQLGAIVAGIDEERGEAWLQFGENLGMAFQIQDDILGIWGDEEVTGKSAATDIRDRKKTLPVVYALQQAILGEGAQELLRLYSQPSPLGVTEVHRVLGLLEEVGARRHAEEMAQEYLRQALAHLDRLRTGSASQAKLRALLSSLDRRTT